MATALGDILAVIRDADPADKAKIYIRLGLRPVGVVQLGESPARDEQAPPQRIWSDGRPGGTKGEERGKGGMPSGGHASGASGAEPPWAAPSDLGDQGLGGYRAEDMKRARVRPQSGCSLVGAAASTRMCPGKIPAWDDPPYRFHA